MKITDSVTLGDARVNDAGYLEANARTARVGIQQYLGVEMGRPDLDVVNVYRDESEVFKKLSLDTFSKIPITLDHPAEPVTAANWKDVAVGTTGDEVLRDGEYLKIGLKITDAEAVKAIQNGKRELSVGYSTDIIWEDGVAADGTEEEALGILLNNKRVPFTDPGMEQIASAARTVMQQATRAGIVADDLNPLTGLYEPAVEIIVPSVFDVPESQRKARVAPAITVRFRYAGAVHYSVIHYHMAF